MHFHSACICNNDMLRHADDQGMLQVRINIRRHRRHELKARRHWINPCLERQNKSQSFTSHSTARIIYGTDPQHLSLVGVEIIHG